MIFYIPLKIAHPVISNYIGNKKPNKISRMIIENIDPSVPMLSSGRWMFKSSIGEISCVLFDKIPGMDPFYELYSHETLFEDTIRIDDIGETSWMTVVTLARSYLEVGNEKQIEKTSRPAIGS
jgi:hypothetical protein